MAFKSQKWALWKRVKHSVNYLHHKVGRVLHEPKVLKDLQQHIIVKNNLLYYGNLLVGKVQRLQLYLPCLAKMYCRKGREGAALQTNIYLQNKHN